MALFRRRAIGFAGANSGEDWQTADEWLTWEPPLNIVRGEQHRRQAFDEVFGTDADGVFVLAMVELVREPTNEHDPNAIRVERNGAHLGYVAKELAAIWAPLVAAAGDPHVVLPGVVRGGGKLVSHGLHLWPHRRLTPAPTFDLDESDYDVSWPPVELGRRHD